MLGKILTDTLERLENYQLTHPEEVSFMQLEIEALKAHMKWMRSHWGVLRPLASIRLRASSWHCIIHLQRQGLICGSQGLSTPARKMQGMSARIVNE